MGIWVLLFLFLGGCGSGGETTTGADPAPTPAPAPSTPPTQPPLAVPPTVPPTVLPVVPPITEPPPSPPVPPPSTLVTMAFTGTLAEDGTIVGTLTYDHSSEPSATNVRGLAPNALYPIKSWSFIVNTGSLEHFAPSTVYSSDIQGDTAEPIEQEGFDGQGHVVCAALSRRPGATIRSLQE